MAPPKKSKYIMEDLKTFLARASISANSNRDLPEPEDAIAGQQQEEPQEHDDVGLEVPVGIQEARNEEEIHVGEGDENELIEVMHSDHIEPDPGLRIPIDNFHPNIRDKVRLAYVANGLPIGHDYPHDHFDRKDTWTGAAVFTTTSMFVPS